MKINNQRQIAAKGTLSDDSYAAFLYPAPHADGFTKLNDIIYYPGVPPWNFVTADSINDDGMITG